MEQRRGVQALLGFLLFTAGCAASPPAEGPAQPAALLVWPPPPAAARIRYVRRLSGPHDAGIEKSFFGRLAETLFGRPEAFLIPPSGVAERNGVFYVAYP